MKILSIITLICVVCLFTFSAHAGEKIAVLDFKSILAPEDLGMAVAEILRTELIGLGDYAVIERGMLEQIMQEQSLQLTGAIDSETAVEIGKLVGAKLVVTGSIVKTGSVYTINARFIDVETGVAKIGQNIRGQGEDQISNMVHQLALIITGKTVVTEETVPAEGATPTPEPPPTPGAPPQLGQPSAPRLPQESTLLFSFETQEEIRQWQHSFKRSSSLHSSKDYTTDGIHSLQINISKSDDWQEIHTTNVPEDWSAYRILAFDLYYKTKRPDEVWPLVVRVDDHRTTRIKRNWFMQGYIIKPEATTIRVYIEDVGRRLDIRQIRQVMFATNKLKHNVEVYLDNIRFENVLPSAPTEPFVFSFEEKGEGFGNWLPNRRQIRFKPVKTHATHGEHSLQVELPRKFPTNKYPGIFSRMFPRNWSNYTQFLADVYYDHKGKGTVTLVVRIDDTASDSYQTRFNWDMELKPGANEIRIPIETINNAIDISRIQAVYLFLQEPKQKTTLYFDNIRVE